MNAKTLTGIYAWAVKGLVFLIPFVTLFISTSMFFPYITGRNFAFRILVEVALVLWVGLMVLDKEYRPKFSIIVVALLSLLVILGLADLFGLNPYKSFWSNFERMEGYISFLHLGAYFFLLASVFKKKTDWLILFHIFGLVGLISGFWGLLQKLGYLRSIQGGFRADGPIGNPAYFAAYLMLVVLILGYLLVNSRGKFLRYLYGIAAFFLLVVIFFSATRGAILALAAAFVLFPAAYLLYGQRNVSERPKYKKIAIGILLLAIIIPASFWLLRGSAMIQKSEIFRRLASISASEGATKARFMVWDMALSRG